jgi:hypothetical protein
MSVRGTYRHKRPESTTCLFLSHTEMRTNAIDESYVFSKDRDATFFQKKMSFLAELQPEIILNLRSTI